MRGCPEPQALGAPFRQQEAAKIGQRSLEQSIQQELAAILSVDAVPVLDVETRAQVVDKKSPLDHLDS